MAQASREVGSPRRIVVALDTGAPGRAALEAAAAIAAAQNAELCRASERVRLLRARTRRELEWLGRELPAGA